MGFDPSAIGNQANQLVPDVGNLAQGALAALNSAIGGSIRGQGGAYPWAGQDSRFFKYITIKPERWDQLFPYRLLVIDTKAGNSIVGGNSTVNAQVNVTLESNNVVSFSPLGRQWVFSLPITPSQLTITDQFAINTTATLRGVLEEHGGIKFKMINASGTMGVWPYRDSVTVPPKSPTILQSVFGGTIEAFGNVKDQVQKVINTATSGHPEGKPVSKRPEDSNAGETSTGYYHAMALQQFLEQYAEAKMNPDNSGWRLVFDIPKQNQSLIVTPMQYIWQQNINKPLEVQYTFQLKGWRRIDLKQKVSATIPDIQPISPGILQRVLATISAARQVTSASLSLIGAVRSDVEAPLDVLRQTSLFVKDLAGVALTAADLAPQFVNDVSSTITAAGAALDINNVITAGGATSADVVRHWQSLTKTNEGLSTSAVSGGQLGSSAASAQSITPGVAAFKNPNALFSVLDQIPTSSLTLTNAQQRAVDEAIESARETTVDTLKQYRATIQELALQLSNNFGTGAAFYSKVYGQPTPTTRIQPISLEEYDILKSLYDVMQSYDILTATTQVDDQNKRTNMEYVAGLADLSGIPFNLTQAKILVPVPFGLTIEGIALRYLGDAQRWLEIATLNNLRDPYIDETGFRLPLLSNATGRQITVSSADNLYIGQRVILMGASQAPNPRAILGIDRLSDTSFLLTLDGAPNLDNFTVSAKSFLQAYLPGTVNSQQKIFVPSNLPIPNDPHIIVPPVTSADPLTGLSKVDWLLTDTGDLAVNNYGDFRFAWGMTNIIQALKLKVGTQKGTILPHPNFGLGIKPGIMNSEVTVQDIYSNLTKMIEEDPRFQGLDNLQVSIDGPKLNLNMGVILAGQNGVFPVNFNL